MWTSLVSFSGPFADSVKKTLESLATVLEQPAEEQHSRENVSTEDFSITERRTIKT